MKLPFYQMICVSKTLMLNVLEIAAIVFAAKQFIR
jgi:hypothetical protein